MSMKYKTSKKNKNLIENSNFRNNQSYVKTYTSSEKNKFLYHVIKLKRWSYLINFFVSYVFWGLFIFLLSWALLQNTLGYTNLKAIAYWLWISLTFVYFYSLYYFNSDLKKYLLNISNIYKWINLDKLKSIKYDLQEKKINDFLYDFFFPKSIFKTFKLNIFNFYFILILLWFLNNWIQLFWFFFYTFIFVIGVWLFFIFPFLFFSYYYSNKIKWLKLFRYSINIFNKNKNRLVLWDGYILFWEYIVDKEVFDNNKKVIWNIKHQKRIRT